MQFEMLKNMLTIRRRKGFFTIILLTSCFIYFNWFINISDWSHPIERRQPRDLNAESVNHHYDSPTLKINENKNSNSYQLIEGFEAIQFRSNSEKNHFVLLAASNHHKKNDENLIIKKPTNSVFDLPEKSSNNPVNKENLKKISETELKDLIKLLTDNNAFLLDVGIFNKIITENADLSKNNLNLNDKIHVKTFSKLTDYIENEESRPILISFGIQLNSFSNLNQKIVENLNENCQYKQMMGNFSNQNILTNLYIECKLLTFQISIVYERNNFLWIGSDDYNVNGVQRKYFGDHPRALNTFNLTQIIDENSNAFNIPSKIKKFLFDYDHSKFLECNRDLAKKNLERIGKNYTQNEKRNKMISTVIEHISETLENFEKHYWLAGGTLLGWYRDCGIIPHTQDVDFAIWAHEYEKKIKKHFLGNKIVRVWGTLGLVNDSYEFRLYNDLFTFDMFLVYKINMTHQWCGYQVNRVKFRRWLPNFDELCSAELLNRKYMVPCDPVEYLNREYGPKNWETPEAKNYTWTNVVYSKNWSDIEWPQTIKYYDKNGKLIKPKILSYLNKHLKHNISSLPPDDVD